MRTAPVLRGGPVLTGVWLVVGLFLFACGIVCFLESRLGLPPWDVLHQGIAKHTPLSFGVANEVVGVVVLFVAWGLGSRPGIATFANAILVGAFVVVLQPLRVAHALGGASAAGRVGVLAVGLVLFGVGSALYIGAGVGAGPRDSLMLVGSKRTGVRVGLVRAGIEASVLVVGFLLGGKVGVGTVLFALLIGPSVEGSFAVASRSRLARAEPVIDAPAAAGRHEVAPPRAPT